MGQVVVKWTLVTVFILIDAQGAYIKFLNDDFHSSILFFENQKYID